MTVGEFCNRQVVFARRQEHIAEAEFVADELSDLSSLLARSRSASGKGHHSSMMEIRHAV